MCAHTRTPTSVVKKTQEKYFEEWEDIIDFLKHYKKHGYEIIHENSNLGAQYDAAKDEEIFAIINPILSNVCLKLILSRNALDFLEISPRESKALG